jgi:hypothetical protein
MDMFLTELVPFVFIPCACLVGLFFNWIIIQTIKKNRKKELKEDFFKYMSVNAQFNFLYCLIFVFYPMTSCNWRSSYYFCSSVFTTQFVQYYKIVMMSLFGEVIKMCANVSYLMMTLNRYLLVGKDHPPWLVSIAKLRFKLFIRSSLIFSALINIGHWWQYQAVEDAAVVNTKGIFSYHFYANGLSFSDYPQGNQGLPYLVYTIVYFLINFGVFFVLNTTIEVKVLRRLHKEIKEKRERIARMNDVEESTTIPPSRSNVNYKEKEEEDVKKESRVLKMVVMNGILNFILRTPDILFWMGSPYILPLSDSFVNRLSDYVPGFLSLIADIGYFAFILTFTTNFVIFFKFNTKFKEAVLFYVLRKKSL